MGDDERREASAGGVTIEGRQEVEIAQKAETEPDVGQPQEADGAQEELQPSAPKKRKKKLAIAGVVVGVIAVVAVGFWVWHNTPGFCNNPVCHDSMDSYVETYSYENGQAGADKWGNEVTDSQAMLCVSHKAEGVACLNCHVADLNQQLGEVSATFSKSYTLPLAERDSIELLANGNRASASGTGDEFCLTAGCHDVTREDLRRVVGNTTVDGVNFNPHNPPSFITINGEQVNHKTYADFQCTDCHKSHRASVVMCTACHNPDLPNNPDFTKVMPSGWVDYKTGKALAEEAYE